MVIKMNTITYSDIEQFNYWWNVSGSWVEEPNRRRGGESGVLIHKDKVGQVFYVKRQEKHIYRSLLFPFGQQTIKRENLAYQAFKKIGIPTPELVYCGVSGDRAILVTKELKGFISFEQWLDQSNNSDANEIALFAVLRSIANVLSKMHKHRFQHNCVYPKHIFINLNDVQQGKENIEIALLDLEKSRKRFTAKQATLHDLPQIKRHTSLTMNEWRYFVQQYEIACDAFFPSLYI
ncbi:InaA protein [Gammaproteobacteria bacterium ESL0073]|nr:InaA protein [Gammaproteobacteria bacterium ESL0073]